MDNRVEQILLQIPLFADEGVVVSVFETIMEEEDDEERHVSEGAIKVRMRNIVTEVGKDCDHEEVSKREQRNKEEEIIEANKEEDRSQ